MDQVLKTLEDAFKRVNRDCNSIPELEGDRTFLVSGKYSGKIKIKANSEKEAIKRYFKYFIENGKTLQKKDKYTNVREVNTYDYRIMLCHYDLESYYAFCKVFYDENGEIEKWNKTNLEYKTRTMLYEDSAKIQNAFWLPFLEEDDYFHLEER